MTEKEKAILRFLKGGDEFHELKIVEATKGLGTVPTSMVLAALEARGLVQLHGQNHSRFYSITGPGEEALHG